MWEFRFEMVGHPLNRSPMLAIRDGDWKLLMNPDRSRLELYDIPNDPMELNNIADAHPDIVDRLADAALTWQQTLAVGPVSDEAGANRYPWPTPYHSTPLHLEGSAT